MAATASSPTPVARMATAITTVAAATSRFRSMVLSTPAASFETGVGTAPAPRITARIVTSASPAGMPELGMFQPAAEPLAGRGQPALDRPHRTPEHLGRLLVRPALQVAEHHRRAEPLGQTSELGVQERPRVVPVVVPVRASAAFSTAQFRSCRRRRAEADRAHRATRKRGSRQCGLTPVSWRGESLGSGYLI